MLASSHRFHGRRSLGLLFQKGKTIRSQAVSVKYVQNPRRHEPRCAVVVGRKVSKIAPVRNRIRRRVYEAVRRNFDVLPPGTDLAFFIYDDSLAQMPAAELEAMVQDLLQRVAAGE